MTDDLKKLVTAGKLTQVQFDKLSTVPVGTYVTHKSWGFGQVKGHDFVTAQIIIDFTDKKAHPMQLAYAADTLAVLHANHIQVKQATDAAGLRKLAEADPAEFMRLILESFPTHSGNSFQIENLFTSFYTTDEWKKIWPKAKAAIKKNPMFITPVKKADPFVLRDTPADLTAEAIASFSASSGIKSHINSAQDLLKIGPTAEHLKTVLPIISDTIQRNKSSNINNAIELALLRDELKAAAGDSIPEPASIVALVQRVTSLRQLFNDLPAARHKRILNVVKQARPETWVQNLLDLMNVVDGKLIPDIADFLTEEGHKEGVKNQIEKVLRQNSASSSLLLWLLRERPQDLAGLFNARLLSAVFAVLDQDRFAREGKFGGKLHDFLMDQKNLVADLVAHADIEEVKDLVRTLQISPAFEELNKRSLLARLIKVFPEVEAQVSGGAQQEQKSAVLHVSWESLEKRKKELDVLINEKVPANIREIEIAKSYGDLRENHEFKAAKEMQKVLARRRAELEQDLDRARGMSYDDPDTASISIGTIAEIEGDGVTEKFVVVGAWDSDPEKNIVSYLTPVGQALLGKKPGETAKLPSGEGTRNVVVKSISKFATAPIA